MLMDVYSMLGLIDRESFLYKESLVTWWDVELEDPTQVDENYATIKYGGIFGISLEDLDHRESNSMSSSDEKYGND